MHSFISLEYQMIELIATCVESKSSEVEDYDATETVVDLKQIKSMIDITDYYKMAKTLGYALREKYGLLMHKDQSLRFGIGKFRGENVICIHKSSIHHFFTYTSKVKNKLKKIYTFIDGERHKYCVGCDEYYPATKEFFYGKRKDSSYIEARCKACYIERYKKPKYLTEKNVPIKVFGLILTLK